MENCPLILPISYDVGNGLEIQQINLQYNEASTSHQENLVTQSNVLQFDTSTENLPDSCRKRTNELQLFVKALWNLEKRALDENDVQAIQKALSNKVVRLRNQAYNAKKRQAKPSTAIVGRKRSSDIEKASKEIGELKTLLEDSYKKLFNPIEYKNKICLILNDCIACIEKQNARKSKK